MWSYIAGGLKIKVIQHRKLPFVTKSSGVIIKGGLKIEGLLYYLPRKGEGEDKCIPTVKFFMDILAWVAFVESSQQQREYCIVISWYCKEIPLFIVPPILRYYYM